MCVVVYSIRAHTVVPWFLLCLTKESSFLYVIKQIQMGHLAFTTTYLVKWCGLKIL